MGSNSFGEIFVITTYGESHGAGIGVVIDGCPSGIPIDLDFIADELRRRKPGQNRFVTERNEDDLPQITSGIFEGKTTGAPIHIFIKNQDQKSKDYENLQNLFRPSHADFTYQKKYGIRDFAGGGRSSARVTASWVAAGAVAKLLLKKVGVEIIAYVSQIGDISTPPNVSLNVELIENDPLRCPDSETSHKMQHLLDLLKEEGDTIGGIITCHIENLPVGLGNPVFHKLHADLGKAILSINACKGFELGSGFSGVAMRGSEHNDAIECIDDRIRTKTNFSGGVQGGISNGMPVYFRAAFKPVSSIKKNQDTIDTDGKAINFSIEGRHDPCVVPRAVPIVEAMAALVVVDHWLMAKGSQFQ